MELGVGYLSIVADTRQMPGQLQKALDGGQAQADKAGQSMGSKIAGGLGKTLKVGVVGAGTAAAGVLAASITKGLGRLNAIEQAQAKLSGLGHSTQSVSKIMDNAMASVKGTAYGLGDAAGIAAGAVAAGVKPGKDLERTLKLVGDSAAIAGTDLGSMGAIFNKVAASNKIQGDVIAQLNDAGIPIIQLLGQELGKSAEETVKLASAGKVNFETFQNAMEKGLGGAALKTGNTAKGAYDNMNAALGRLGATLAGPAFRQAPAALGGITKWIDELEGKAKPAVAQFESDLTGKYIPALKEFAAEVAHGWEQFRGSDFAISSMGRIQNLLDGAISTARDVAPAVGSIITSLSKASGALGVSTWEIFLTTLEGTAQILDVTLVPVLKATGSLMENHQGFVTAAAAAWMLFKTVPAIVGRVGTAIEPVTRRVDAARTSLRGFGDTMRLQQTLAGQAGQSISRYSAAMGALGSHVPAIGRMQMAYRNAADDATRFARTQGTVAGAVSGLRTAGSGLLSVFGGPWGAAFAAASIAAVGIGSAMGKAEKQAEALTSVSNGVAAAQREVAKAFGESSGEVTPDAITAATKAIDELRSGQQAIIDQGPGFWDPFVAAGKDIQGIFTGNWWQGTSEHDAREAVKQQAEALKSEFETLGMTTEELGQKMSGTESDWRNFVASLRGQDLNTLADELENQRAKFVSLQESMRQIGPASTAVTSGLEEIAGAAGDGNKKLDGLKRTLQGLGILQTDLQKEAFETAAAVREIADAAAKGIDQSKGFGSSLFKDDGSLNGAKENAVALSNAIEDLGGRYLTLRNGGMEAGEALATIKPGLDALADTYGVQEQIDGLARSIGGIAAEDVTIALAVEGGDEAWRAISDLQLQLRQLPDDGKPKTVKMRVEDEAARDAIRQLGFDVKQIGDNPAAIEVTANNSLALIALDQVRRSVAGLNISVADPKIGADTTAFRIEDQKVRGDLESIRGEVADPKIGAVLDEFLAGRDVTLKTLGDLDIASAEPDVRLLIEQALGQAKVVNDAIDKAARERTATINVVEYRQRQQAFWDSGQQGPVSMFGPGLATGGRLPTTGPGTDRTDGFLAVNSAGAPIARVDAGEWVINGRSSQEYDRELAMINAGTFPRLPGFADGGLVGGLKDFVAGRIGGASRPLTGAPYVWGGVNWGDCSGAMSAIARFAVGLAPFAARFATGTMVGALASMGFSRGRGGPGDLRFGWYNGGPYGGHTAGTLPDGTNVEMGGAYGGGMVGGSTGSNSPEFTDHAFLPIGGGFDWSDPGGYAAGGRGRVSRSGSTRKRPEWTDKQQLDLENAEIEVRKAEEARTKVEAELAKGKKTQTDLDSANKKIELAQQKVVDLQKKKDDVASWVEDGPAPQAPALSRMFSDAEIERIDAQLAVDAANERRNEVYDDPDSTETELAKADAELFKAQKALREMGISTGETASSWSELAGEVAKTAVSGYLSDTFGVLGIPDEIPPAMRAWQMFEKAQAEQNPYLLEPSADERAAGAQVTPIDPGMAPLSAILGDSPVLYDAQRGVAQLGDQIADGLNTVGGPASEAAVALRAEIEKFRGAGRYWNGGTVDGPPGIDQVPAWLTAKEIVLNTAAAAAGDNAAIAAAMNAGTKFLVGGQKSQRAQPDAGNDYGAADHSRCVHYHLYGIGDVDEALARIRTEEKVRGMTHGGSL